MYQKRKPKVKRTQLINATTTKISKPKPQSNTSHSPYPNLITPRIQNKVIIKTKQKECTKRYYKDSYKRPSTSQVLTTATPHPTPRLSKQTQCNPHNKQHNSPSTPKPSYNQTNKFKCINITHQYKQSTRKHLQINYQTQHKLHQTQHQTKSNPPLSKHPFQTEVPNLFPPPTPQRIITTKPSYNSSNHHTQTAKTQPQSNTTLPKETAKHAQ